MGEDALTGDEYGRGEDVDNFADKVLRSVLLITRAATVVVSRTGVAIFAFAVKLALSLRVALRFSSEIKLFLATFLTGETNVPVDGGDRLILVKLA